MQARFIAGRAAAHSSFAHHFPQLEQLIVELSMLSDRYRQFRVAACMTVAAFLVAGCAERVPEVPITYIPQSNVQLLKDAGAVPIEDQS